MIDPACRTTFQIDCGEGESLMHISHISKPHFLTLLMIVVSLAMTAIASTRPPTNETLTEKKKTPENAPGGNAPEEKL